MYQPTEINRNKLPSDEYKIEVSGGWEGSRETGLPSVSFSFRFGGAKPLLYPGHNESGHRAGFTEGSCVHTRLC